MHLAVEVQHAAARIVAKAQRAAGMGKVQFGRGAGEQGAMRAKGLPHRLAKGGAALLQLVGNVIAKAQPVGVVGIDLLDRSIKPGDVISLGDTFGWIEELGARYVSVVTRDGREYLIPNEDLVTGQVVNWSHTNNYVRLDLKFGASYQDDPHKVSEIAIKAALGVGRVISSRRPVCWITGFGDSSVDYVLRFWIGDATGGLTNVRGQVFLALWDAFKEHGVSIPFPQREVRLLNEALAVRQQPDGPESAGGH